MAPQDDTIKPVRGKPMPVHSPKVRLFMGAAVGNAQRIRASTIGAHMDYSKENAQPVPTYKPRGCDSRGLDIAARARITQMDKILNPSKEEYTPPPVNLRCPANQGKENQERSRGTLQLMGSGPIKFVPSSQVFHNCPSSDALSNQEKGRGSGMTQVIQQEGGYQSPIRARGVQSADAEDNRSKHRGAMSTVLDQTTKYYPPPVQARGCPDDKGKAEQQRHQGCIDKLFNGTLPLDNQPNPRVRPQAERYASAEGRGMMDTIVGGPKLDDVPPPRVKKEAHKNAVQGQGTLTNIQYNYNKLDSETRPPPRVKKEAQEIANSAQGRATKMLFHKYGKLPGDVPLKPHIPPRARKIAKLSQGGSMKDAINPSKPYKRRRAKSAY